MNSGIRKDLTCAAWVLGLITLVVALSVAGVAELLFILTRAIEQGVHP